MKMTIHIEIENNEQAEAVIKTLAGISPKVTTNPVTESAEPAPATKGKAKTETAEKSVDIDDLRTLFADKKRAGFTAELKAILNEHDAAKLSEVEEADFAAVYEKAAAL